jgi:hypothetical protein
MSAMGTEPLGAASGGSGGKARHGAKNPRWNTLCHSIVVEVDLWTTPR